MSLTGVEAPRIEEYRCQLCDFMTDSEGRIVRHYHAQHPEEEM